LTHETARVSRRWLLLQFSGQRGLCRRLIMPVQINERGKRHSPSVPLLRSLVVVRSTPHKREWIFALGRRSDQAAFFQCLHCVPICRCGTYYLVVLYFAQQWLATERIRFEFITILHVPEQVSFYLRKLGGNFSRRFFSCIGNLSLTFHAQLSKDNTAIDQNEKQAADLGPPV
jgi:hypothetical protein